MIFAGSAWAENTPQAIIKNKSNCKNPTIAPLAPAGGFIGLCFPNRRKADTNRNQNLLSTFFTWNNFGKVLTHKVDKVLYE